MDLFSQNDSEQAIYLEYEGDKNGNRVPDPEEIGIKHFKGDGDFRSKECIELLKQADIVVTNPPFSLFREYVSHLVEYDKKFIIIGSLNAITYREIFTLIKGNKIWLGYGFKAGNAFFATPHSKEFAKGVYDEETGLVKFRNVTWFTNMDIAKRHKNIICYKQYNEEEYPTYENYEAININRVKEIPIDFDGAMGVPITFLDKFNPEQFEIIGLGISNSGLEFGVRPYKEEHKKYRKEIQKRGAVDGDLYMMTDGVVNVPYARIIIRNKQQKRGNNGH
jgi:hypothetical protein